MKKELGIAAMFALGMLAVTPFALASGPATPSTANAGTTFGANSDQKAVPLAKEEKDDDEKNEKDGKKDADKEESDEETITIDQAPAAVQAAIKKAIGDNKLEKLTKEEGEEGEKDEKGKKEETRYEASFKDHGANHTISFVDSGKIVEDELEIKVSELPDAVKKAVAAKAHGAEIEKAERVKADGKTFYEVVVGEGKDAHEIKVSEDGKIIAKHEDDDDEKEGKEKK